MRPILFSLRVPPGRSLYFRFNYFPDRAITRTEINFVEIADGASINCHGRALKVSLSLRVQRAKARLLIVTYAFAASFASRINNDVKVFPLKTPRCKRGGTKSEKWEPELAREKKGGEIRRGLRG